MERCFNAKVVLHGNVKVLINAFGKVIYAMGLMIAETTLMKTVHVRQMKEDVYMDQDMVWDNVHQIENGAIVLIVLLLQILL